jgi:hypothetical protein
MTQMNANLWNGAIPTCRDFESARMSAHSKFLLHSRQFA